jgi:hypothetical protein
MAKAEVSGLSAHRSGTGALNNKKNNKKGF